MDSTRSHEEKLRALICSDRLPVAVRDLKVLEARVGAWATIPGMDPLDAVRLTSIHDPVFADYFDVDHHLWVRPGLKRDGYGYLKAWTIAAMPPLVPGAHQLDHLHAKTLAEREGYGFVVLSAIPSGPNMGAGSVERLRAATAISNMALQRPVRFADEVHWAKLWGLNQLRPGELTYESTGAWRKRPGR